MTRKNQLIQNLKEKQNYAESEIKRLDTRINKLEDSVLNKIVSAINGIPQEKIKLVVHNMANYKYGIDQELTIFATDDIKNIQKIFDDLMTKIESLTKNVETEEFLNSVINRINNKQLKK